MQNTRILTKTDELVAVPDVAKEIKPHFTTVNRWSKKRKAFSFPYHNANYLGIDGVQV